MKPKTKPYIFQNKHIILAVVMFYIMLLSSCSHIANEPIRSNVNENTQHYIPQPTLEEEEYNMAKTVPGCPPFLVEGAKETTPELFLQKTEVFKDAEIVSYTRQAPLKFGSGENYTDVKGVVTFRGNNFRDGGTYGTASHSKNNLVIEWEISIGARGKWSGVGWNGQPVIVKWPLSMQRNMNISNEMCDDDLVEVIYGTLDGKIYFLDLKTGQQTRDPIIQNHSIKGSVSVDPRGYPLLYVGTGIGGGSRPSGWRIYSLIDQKELFVINGADKLAYRHHKFFDSVCLVDSKHDTLIECAENGLVYSMDLNTVYDEEKGIISVSPKVTTYRYTADIKEYGIENSPVAYDRYIWFADNSGLITCMDTTTMTPLWVRNCTDDTDASLVLEQDGENLYLYTGCEVDKQGRQGVCWLRKLNALTGTVVWEVGVNAVQVGNTDAGVLATPLLGKNNLDRMVYFSVTKTAERGNGIMLALDKDTGKEVWSLDLIRSSWSSPVCVYDNDGQGVILHAGGTGTLRMIDGLNGNVLASCELGANVEGSPTVFDDMLVIGTRGRKIFGVKIS